MERSVLIASFHVYTDVVWQASNHSQHNTTEPSCLAQHNEARRKADMGITSSPRRKNLNAQNESTIQISALCACQQQLVVRGVRSNGLGTDHNFVNSPSKRFSDLWWRMVMVHVAQKKHISPCRTSSVTEGIYFFFHAMAHNLYNHKVRAEGDFRCFLQRFFYF